MRFTATKIRFGPRPAADDDDESADGLPTPHRLKVQRRRALAIREAADLLRELPGPGESVHALMSRRLDLADLIDGLLQSRGHCEQLCVATLGFSARNLRAMLKWIDAGKVNRLWLLSSLFYRGHNAEAWQTTQEEFIKRGQHCACAPSHCKVCAFAFSSGERFVIEGSANLAASGSVAEQIAVINDPGLHGWHQAWIVEKVSKHETEKAK